MNNPMEIAARWEHATYQFIEYAKGLVPADQNFSTMHVMLAALADLAPEHATVNSVLALLDERRREQCRSAISVQLALYPEIPKTPDGFAPALVTALTQWEQDALKRNVRVTTSFIIWHLFMHQETIRTIFTVLGVDIDALTRSLEHHFDTLFASISEPIAGPTTGEPIYLEVREFTEQVRPSSVLSVNPARKLLYTGMHAVLMSNILNILGTLDPTQIAILTGANGTPLYYVDQVLADTLEAREYQVDDRPRLHTRYERIYRLNLSGVRSLADQPTRPPPHLVLRMAIQEAEKNKAILVIKNMETLSAHTEADRAILSVLSEPSKTLILGLYETGVYSAFGPLQTLNLSNAVEIAARSYSLGQTRNLLQEYYLPQWEDRYGYAFVPNAFDSIIALEPGAWINLRRKTLPYLVIGLALDTIQTVRGGNALIAETAHMAIDALTLLEEEWATTERMIREKYKDTLEQARADIEGLILRPQPERDPQGRYLITRGHVIAQLICPNDSEFHYPGHSPKELVAPRQGDYPQHNAQN